MLFEWTLLAIVASLSIWQWRSLTACDKTMDRVEFSPEARQIMAKEDKHIQPGFDVLAIVCFVIYLAGVATGTMWRETFSFLSWLVK